MIFFLRHTRGYPLHLRARLFRMVWRAAQHRGAWWPSETDVRAVGKDMWNALYQFYADLPKL